MDVIYIDTDNVLEIEELTNGLTGAAITDATVSVTLLDSDGAEIAGESWPVTMSYIVGTTAAYRATLTDSLTLTDRQEVTAHIVADAGDGLHREWQKPFTAVIGT